MKFILFTHSISRIPSTIISRSQKMNLTISIEELNSIQLDNCEIITWLMPILHQGNNINPIKCARIADKYSTYTTITRILSWMYDVLRVKYRLKPVFFSNEIFYLEKSLLSINDQKNWVESYFEILNMKRISRHSLNTKLFFETLFFKFKNGFN